MTEKKRFPWSLVACAVLMVLLAVVLGFIETVGRRRTIVSRYNLIPAPDLDTLWSQTEYTTPEVLDAQVFMIMGTCDSYLEHPGGTDGWSKDSYFRAHGRFPECVDRVGVPRVKVACWHEGPVRVSVTFTLIDPPPIKPGWYLWAKNLEVTHDGFTWWHLRRWAEQAYTAIHGPRR